jgi:hypothetical protein
MLFAALIGINAALALAGALGQYSPDLQRGRFVRTDPDKFHTEAGVSTIFVGLGEDP